MNAFRTLALALGLTIFSGAVLSDEASARPRRDHDRHSEVRRPMPHRQMTAQVRLVNDQRQWVSVYLDGRYITNLAPGSRANVRLPVGYQTLTYRVGQRNVFRSVAVNVRSHGNNRVTIPNQRGGHYERVGWW